MKKYFYSSDVKKLLSAIYRKSQELGRAPKASQMKSLSQQCRRKIGSWRFALWLSGAIANQRKYNYKQINQPNKIRKIKKRNQSRS